MSARTLDLEWGWIVRSHIGWGEELRILYKGVETSPYEMRFKNFEGKSVRESPKRIISANGDLGWVVTDNEHGKEQPCLLVCQRRKFYQCPRIS